MAKIDMHLKFLFCAIYRVLCTKGAVLGDSFRPKNVPCVPSHFGPERCQMVQVRRVRLDLSGELVHPSNGKATEDAGNRPAAEVQWG